MIRLIRPTKPEELTVEFVTEQTEEFKRSGKHVWNREWLRRALRNMSDGKCAFCECKLEEESKYLEVEHFAHKNEYPDRVVEWDNLLPACRRCNGHKGIHDVVVYPIVDPASMEPRDHLQFCMYRFRGITETGRCTVEVLELNDPDRLMLTRFKVGDAVLQQLDMIARMLRDFKLSKLDARPANRILRLLRSVLREAQRGAEYASTAATVVLESEDYGFARAELTHLGLWALEFEDLHKGMEEIAFI